MLYIIKSMWSLERLSQRFSEMCEHSETAQHRIDRPSIQNRASKMAMIYFMLVSFQVQTSFGGDIREGSLFLSDQSFEQSIDFLGEMERHMQTSDSDKCNTVNLFPVFYGGILNNFVRGLHISPNEDSIIMCGESYSPQNFVDRSIEAYLLKVDSRDGSYIWGKYYQNTKSNSTDYIGLFYQCKFVSDQKIIVSGQLNFFKSFIGIVNASSGTFIEAYQFTSTNTDYKVGYASYALEWGAASSNIYAGLSFLGAPLSIARIEQSRTDSQGRYYRASTAWVRNIGTSSVTGGQQNPSMCVDSLENTVYVGTSVQYNDGFSTSSVAALVSLSASTGQLYQFKKNIAMNSITQMTCLAQQQGAIGCGMYAATSFIFRVDKNLGMLYNYMFTGDNPEYCAGLFVSTNNLFVLLESQSTMYTRTGYTDAVILTLNVDGRPRSGVYVTYLARQQLSRGIFMMSDGSLVYAGATKKVLDHNYQYNAIFLQRMNPNTGEKTCMSINNVPDFRAISYSLQNYTDQYSDAPDSILNQYLTVYQNNYLTILDIPVKNVTAWDVKAPVPYKQFQQCFIQEYDNPYEKIVKNRTEITLVVPKDQILYSQTFVYYQGEINQVKNIENWLYDLVRTQGDMKVSLSNGAALPTFLAYDKKKGQLAVYTNSQLYIGRYAVQFAGCYNYKIARFFQSVEIRANTAPFLNFTQLSYNFTIGSAWQISIPQIIDKESNSEFMLTITTQETNRKITKLPYFMTYDTISQLINVNPKSQVDVAPYKLYVRVWEVDAPSYLSDYVINVNVIPIPSNQTANSTSGKLLYGVLDDSEVMNSLIAIDFSMEIAIPPQSYLTIKEQEFIKLSVSGLSEPYDFTWKIMSIDQSTITFSINFQEPNIVGLFSENEVVKIEFNKMLIRSADDQANYLQNTVYEQELSMIIENDDQELAALAQVAQTMKAVLATVMGATVISQAAMSHAMQNLWAVINSLQLLSYMAFMHINLTPQLFIVFKMLLASHFDAIPLKDYIQEFLVDPDTNDDGSPNTANEKPFTENMGLFGYESSLFYLNMIDGFLLVMSLVIVYVLLRIAKLIPIRFKKYQEFVDGRLKEYKYNLQVRTFLELQLDLVLWSFIGFVKFAFVDGKRDSSIGISIVIFPALVSLIPFCYRYLKNKQHEFKNEKTDLMEKIGSIVEGVNVARPWALNFNVFFMMRRVYFTILFAFPPEYYVQQLSLNLLHCIAQVSYLILVRPYLLKKSNFQETFNECCILSVACLIFCLTDLVENYKLKLKIGWVIIFIIFATVLFNLCLIAYLAIVSLRNWIANYLAKKKAMKYEISMTDQGELNRRSTTGEKGLNFHDASQMKDFIVPEEIKEGEPYIPERHIMHDYLPDEGGRRYQLGNLVGGPMNRSQMNLINDTSILESQLDGKPITKEPSFKKKRMRPKVIPDGPSIDDDYLPPFGQRKVKKGVLGDDDAIQTYQGKTNQDPYSNQQRYSTQQKSSRHMTKTPSDFNEDDMSKFESRNVHVNELLQELSPTKKLATSRQNQFLTQPQVNKEVTNSVEQLITEEIKNTNLLEQTTNKEFNTEKKKKKKVIKRKLVTTYEPSLMALQEERDMQPGINTEGDAESSPIRKAESMKNQEKADHEETISLEKQKPDENKSETVQQPYQTEQSLGKKSLKSKTSDGKDYFSRTKKLKELITKGAGSKK